MIACVLMANLVGSFLGSDGGCLVSAPAELSALFCRGGAVQQRKRALVAASAVAAAAAECVRAAEKQRQLPLPLPSLDALPDECLFEILRRVPGGRGRGASACVSRRWLALLAGIRASEAVLAPPAPAVPDLNMEYLDGEDDDDSWVSMWRREGGGMDACCAHKNTTDRARTTQERVGCRGRTVADKKA